MGIDTGPQISNSREIITWKEPSIHKIYFEACEEDSERFFSALEKYIEFTHVDSAFFFISIIILLMKYMYIAAS